MRSSGTLVLIPTYNERDNVDHIAREVLRLEARLDLLFIDDGSPDGTGALLDQLADEDARVRVMHRPRRLGIGSAHLAGIRWAYDHGYDTLVTMDGDFSHPPRYLPRFLELARDHDIVVGSRYIQRESLRDWNLFRKALTLMAHLLTTRLLKMPYDATGAYRVYRLDRISPETFDVIRSTGYSFFFESLYVFHVNRYSIKEEAITLPARTYGHSKMSLREALRSVKRLFKIYWGTWTRPNAYRVAAGIPEASSLGDQASWNRYWSTHRGAGALYDVIARFYRRYIVRPILNHFLGKYFTGGSRVLHGGCGSGQVDVDVAKTISITALDFSSQALCIYRSIHGRSGDMVCGDILSLPFKDESFDGVYNLGVMEHFTGPDIARILGEFHRVLKSDRPLIIFWPPEFGLSVRFLKVVHYVLNTVLGKGIRLHPDEISRIQSRGQAERLFEASGFEVAEYYFGPRDVFTYAVIVAFKASAVREKGRAGLANPVAASASDCLSLATRSFDRPGNRPL